MKQLKLSQLITTGWQLEEIMRQVAGDQYNPSDMLDCMVLHQATIIKSVDMGDFISLIKRGIKPCLSIHDVEILLLEIASAAIKIETDYEIAKQILTIHRIVWDYYEISFDGQINGLVELFEQLGIFPELGTKIARDVFSDTEEGRNLFSNNQESKGENVFNGGYSVIEFVKDAIDSGNYRLATLVLIELDKQQHHCHECEKENQKSPY
jgi:hypothetical protein